MKNQIHIHRHEATHVSAQVTERRAPTDESVKLLREMERAAKDEVLKALRLEPINGGDVVLWQMPSLESGEYVFKAIFMCGGQRHEVEHRASCFGDVSEEEVFTSLRDNIALVVAQAMLAPAFMKALEQWGLR